MGMIVASLAVLVVLLRLKVRIGVAMTVSAVVLAVLLRVAPGAMWDRLAAVQPLARHGGRR